MNDSTRGYDFLIDFPEADLQVAADQLLEGKQPPKYIGDRKELPWPLTFVRNKLRQIQKRTMTRNLSESSLEALWLEWNQMAVWAKANDLRFESIELNGGAVANSYKQAAETTQVLLIRKGEGFGAVVRRAYAKKCSGGRSAYTEIALPCPKKRTAKSFKPPQGWSIRKYAGKLILSC